MSSITLDLVFFFLLPIFTSRTFPTKEEKKRFLSRSGRRYNDRELFGKSGLISVSEKTPLAGEKERSKCH